ncbi:MAG TPA: AAA family ATPase [Streptosporangiaceae bacterium]|nr:AAA family ATPase [Streptosporangiaceae bacterium]
MSRPAFSPPPFVGRQAELAELRRAWEAAQHDRSRVIVLVGGSGIGKTALVGHFLRDADPARQVWIRGAQDEQSLSWGVLGQLATSLSALSGRHPDWVTPDPEADPLYVGQSLLDNLRTVGQTVLVLDDAQWADRKSQAALRFVARHMFSCPLVLIVIHGDQARLDDGWRRVCEPEHATLLELAGLTPEELVSLAVARGNFGLSPAGAARLHKHTGGNPLHTWALLEQVPIRTVVSGSGPLPAPTTIAETVANTITAYPEPVQAVLSAGAVIGTAFGAAEVSALTGLADPTPLLDRAIAAGLISETPGIARQQFTFSHALVHRAVYEQTGLAHRRELHLRAAGMMYGAEALRHRVAAAGGTDPVLADDLERQATVDVSRGELASAAMHREQALYCTPPGPERTPRLLAVVEAELVAGDAVSARRFADELAAGGGDPWWDYVAGYQSLLAGQVGEAQLRLGRALDATATGSAPARAPADLRARIATQLAIIGLVSLSYPEMIEYGRIAVAENSADPRVSAFAWFARTVGLALAGRGSQALADLDARGTGPGLEPLIAQGMVKLWTDDLDGAIQHLKEATERTYRGEALRVGQALAFLGDAEYRRGLLAESVLHTELAVGDAEENERYWDYALLHGLACQTQAALGDWARAEEHSSAAVLWAPLVGTRAGLLSAAGTRAVIAQARGDAVALLKAAEDFETVFDPLEPGITLLGPLKAEALAQLGRIPDAAAALAEFTERFGAMGRKSTDMGIARVRGRIAAAAHAHSDALVLYNQALDTAWSLGLPLEAGRLEMLIGECFAEIGNYDAAGLWLRSALQRFTGIGAGAYYGLALDAILARGLSPEALPDRLAALTPGERRVALVAKTTLSNRDIAEQMCVDQKTIEYHLTNIYRKLGVPGRAGLRKLLDEPQ